MSNQDPMFQGVATFRLDPLQDRLEPRQSTALEDAGVALFEQLVAEGMDPFTAREVARQQGLTMLENQPLIRPGDLAVTSGTALALGDYEQDPGLLTGAGVVASMLGLGLPARLARRGIEATARSAKSLSRGLGSLLPKSDFTKALEGQTISVKPGAEDIPFSDKEKAGIQEQRAARGAAKARRSEFVPESETSMQYYGSREMLALNDGSTGGGMSYKSKLLNAVHNPDSLLQMSPNPNKKMDSKGVRNRLKRMGVTDSELDMTGVETLLSENDKVSLKQLKDWTAKYSPQLRITRAADSAEQMPNKQHQRWVHMPRDTGRATNEYNVVDYEETIVFDTRPSMTTGSVGDTHYGELYTPNMGDASYDSVVEVTEQQGHYRGSVLTEFDDGTMNELFPDGAFLSEEIQTDFNFAKRDRAGTAAANQREFDRVVALGYERVSDLRSSGLDDMDFMNTVAEYLPVEFEQGATDFGRSARNFIRTNTGEDVVVSPADIDPQAIDILEAAIDYRSAVDANLGPVDQEFEILRDRLRDQGYSSQQMQEFVKQLNSAPPVPRNVKTFMDKLYDISDSQSDIQIASRKMDRDPPIEIKPGMNEKKRAADSEYARQVAPIETEFKNARYELNQARQSERQTSQAFQAAMNRESIVGEEVEALENAAEAQGITLEAYLNSMPAMDRAQADITLNAQAQNTRDIRNYSQLLKEAKETTREKEALFAKEQAAFTKFNSDFNIKNPEFAELRRAQLEPQFVFDDEKDFVRFIVDTQIEQARAKGLSGVIFPDWQDIRDLRLSAPEKGDTGDYVDNYKKASEKYRIMYNDVVKSRLNEHKAANPGSRVVTDLPINSTSDKLPGMRRRSSEFFGKKDEPRKPFGYSFGRVRANRAEKPAASVAEGGLVMKGIGSMGREVL